jgi:hypothetical protein
MARRNGALELFSLVRFSCRVYRTHTSPLVSVCVCVCLSLSLSLSRTSAVKFCWNLCTESAKRLGTLFGGVFPVYFGRRISSVFQVCGLMVHQEQSAEEMDERNGHRLSRIQQHLQSGMSLCFPAKP